MGKTVLAIDQGTTSTRAMLFGAQGEPLHAASEPLEQIYPQAGWVEHDAAAIWQAVLKVGRDVLKHGDAKQVAAIGITNQRETTVVWDRITGEPLANAIVWQDRRTDPLCRQLEAEGLAPHVARVTGLVLDPYFSATKLAWLLEHVPGLRARAQAGDACFGTIDSWLIWKLTGGATHASDATNASRTMLYDIGEGRWDQSLIQRLDIPAAMLPRVMDCQADFGMTLKEHFGAELPILGCAGDQQAAAFGQACFEPGMIKATYGTGCFMLVNTGARRVHSRNRMLATIGERADGKVAYALEGSIFMAGATIQWLRDTLGLFRASGDSEALARAADPRSGVVIVPAFQGLGAPHWDAAARGAILGLSRSAGRNEIVRAGLESVAFQTVDLLEAIARDMEEAGLGAPETLRVDGGMTANDWAMQFLADVTRLPVEVARHAEATALGAAWHAGLRAGVYPSREYLSGRWQSATRLDPVMPAGERDERLGGWRRAVERVLTGAS
ncbi:MAG: glycerol kinase GlpK [Pseudomonadota bacterium]|nr:glycerol kinase GlpK [Pseudomonadota bacterium]